MDHIVRYTTSSGDDKIEDVSSLDAAIARVEALRNDEGVDNPRLYREVKVEFKTYVRAEVVEDGASAGGGAPATASAGQPAPAARATSTSEPPPGAMPLNPQRPTTKVNEVVTEQDEAAGDDGDGEGGRRTLFSRGG